MSARHRLVPFERALTRRQHSSPWDDPWSDMASPSRAFDQYFGMSLTDDDLLPAMPSRESYYRRLFDDDFFRGARSRNWDDDLLRAPPMMRQRSVPGQSGVSEVTSTTEEFKVNLDVLHFKPEEINVKTVDNKVVISAKHEERADEHGLIMREFKRSYLLPADVDPMSVKSTLSADGVLSIKAPKKTTAEAKEHVIPIEHNTTSELNIK